MCLDRTFPNDYSGYRNCGRRLFSIQLAQEKCLKNLRTDLALSFVRKAAQNVKLGFLKENANSYGMM